MAYQIILKKRFTNKVQKVLVYLKKEWSHKVATDFLLKIDGASNCLPNSRILVPSLQK